MTNKLQKSNKQNVTEEQLLKALGELEGDAEEYEEEFAKGDDEDSDEDSSDEESSEMDKSHTESEPGMPDDTMQANGGMAKLAGRAEDDNFEVDADEDDPSGGSMKSLVNDNDTLRKGFEVSSFLEELVDTNVAAVDSLAKSQADFQHEQRSFNAKIQKALVAMGDMMLRMQRGQEEAGEAPVVARPRAVLAKSDIAERFAPEAGARVQYTREQTLEALTDLAMKGEVPAVQVSAYETSSHVDPSYHQLVNTRLKALFG
jgi:hypothetical protein